MRCFCHISPEQMETTHPLYFYPCTCTLVPLFFTTNYPPPVLVLLYTSAPQQMETLYFCTTLHCNKWKLLCSTTVAGSSSSCQEINNREGGLVGRHRWLTNGSEYFNPLPPSDQLILWLTAGFGRGLKTGGARGGQRGPEGARGGQRGQGDQLTTDQAVRSLMFGDIQHPAK